MKSNKRIPNSLFDQVCKFVNSIAIGTTVSVNELNNSVTENYTPWKRRYRDPYYCTRLYAGLLRKAGVLIKNKRGTWTILAHVPDNVTLDMISTANTPWDKLWKADRQFVSQVDNTINTPIVERIIIFVIIGKHIEPTEVLKTQVGALLSTGNYFEDEMDAWYFLSIGTGVAVESLKADWRKTKDFANNVVEITKAAEAQEDADVLEGVERLDGLLTIVSSGWSSRIKIWYGIKDLEAGPRVIKYEVREEQVCKNNMYENESLLNLLKCAAEEVDVDIEDIIEENLVLIESEIHEKLDAEFVKKAEEEKAKAKLITFKDIRGNDVYYKDSKNIWCKGVIIGLQIQAFGDTTPEYSNIHVKTQSGSTQWIEYKVAKFSKEEVLSLVTESINSL